MRRRPVTTVNWATLFAFSRILRKDSISSLRSKNFMAQCLVAKPLFPKRRFRNCEGSGNFGNKQVPGARIDRAGRRKTPGILPQSLEVKYTKNRK